MGKETAICKRLMSIYRFQYSQALERPFSEGSLCLCRFYAAQCCGPVTSTVGKMSLIMQQVPSDAVANAWFNELGNTYMGGAHPSFDLARCLAQDGDAVDLNVS